VAVESERKRFVKLARYRWRTRKIDPISIILEPLTVEH
jgi:hypothetical protein